MLYLPAQKRIAFLLGVAFPKQIELTLFGAARRKDADSLPFSGRGLAFCEIRRDRPGENARERY
jgi:hypothetical protein